MQMTGCCCGNLRVLWATHQSSLRAERGNQVVPKLDCFAALAKTGWTNTKGP